MGDSADRPNRHRTAAPSAAAERMRRYRARRRAGFTVVPALALGFVAPSLPLGSRVDTLGDIT
jgi:hypothetical protein